MKLLASNALRAHIISLAVSFIVCGCGKSGKSHKPEETAVGIGVASEGPERGPKPQGQEQPPSSVPVSPAAMSATIPPAQVATLKALALTGYPDITTVIGVRDAVLASKAIEAVGGRIDYDPNLGRGATIQFLVATLPPAKLVDADFLRSLDLIDIQVNLPQHNYAQPAGASAAPFSGGHIRIPFSEVGVEELRKRKPGLGLGEGVTLAVIDTGVDASHHVFGDRVAYWSDETQEGRVPLSLAKLDAKGDLVLGTSTTPVPAKLRANAPELYVGVFDEKAMAIQVTEEERAKGDALFDINRNDHADKMLVLVYKDKESGEWLAAYDVDANQAISDAEADRSIMDFNRWREKQRHHQATPNQGFVSFKATNRSIKYPLMIGLDKRNSPTFVSVGIDFGEHGTHVAGIAAGGSEYIEGAAPKAQVMALKVCTKVTCSTPAIIRGLLKAFYNEQGLVPDVVNISLGSPQGYRETVFDRLIRDLSAKFGTVFFIAASNDGPGYRSINDLGSLSPAVLVGAHASRQTLIEHYRLSQETQIQQNQLLFFSSVGPSFSGELRPNIVAPGSALSSTPLASSRSRMFNGTSMSSPLAAGATVALISLLKTEPSYAPFDALIKRKRDLMQALWRGGQAEEDAGSYSLNTAALAFRTALEDSAVRTDFANYASAQIGHGLLNVDKAYPVMLAKAQHLASVEDAKRFSNTYGSWKFNQNGLVKVYERGVEAEKVKKIELSAYTDGEESEIELEALEVEPITVKLVRVEEQAEDGSVLVLDPSKRHLPFSIGDAQNINDVYEGTVVINNDRKANFLSMRHLDRMKDGHTYLAVYDLFQFGIRMNTILDVVHRPEVFSDLVKNYQLPSISQGPIREALSLAREKKTIKAGQFHRYFVPVFDQDTRMEVALGLPEGQGGKLSIMAYDPDGRPIASEDINKTEESTFDKPTVNVKFKTVDKKGLYEVIVANSNGAYLVDAKYDLLIHKVRFVSTKQPLKLAVGEEKRIVFSDLNSSEVIVGVSSSLSSRIVSLGSAKVVPNHRTFTQLVFPESLKGVDTFSLNIAIPNATTNAWSGRLDPNLYTVDSKGEATIIEGVPFLKGSYKSKSFKGVDLSKGPVFAAIETTSTLPEDRSINQGVTTVPLEAELFTPSINEELSVTQDASSTPYAYVYVVKAPKAISMTSVVLRGQVSVTLSSGMRFSIPVEVAP